MKILITICTLVLAFFLACVQLNYKYAVRDAINSDGTDSGIEDALHNHGFDKKWHESISFGDKVNAFFNTL